MAKGHRFAQATLSYATAHLFEYSAVGAPPDNPSIVRWRDRSSGGDGARCPPAALQADVLLFLLTNVFEHIAVKVAATACAGPDENCRIRPSRCHKRCPF